MLEVEHLAVVVTAGTAVAWIGEERTTRADIVGAKAASLARAAARGLPVLPGFVVTTTAAALLEDGPPTDSASVEAELRSAWDRLSQGGAVALVVRSSSTVEDSTTSSMAGQFTSVVDVEGWDDFRAAVTSVLASRNVVSLRKPSRDAAGAPMAVLVQPFLAAATGGVIFGVDPVTGRRDRMLVAATTEGPAALVSGRVDGVAATVSRRGRVLACRGEGNDVVGLVGRRRLHRLVALARRVAVLFGGPQDVEWAFGHDDRLWLLQSRPVTAEAAPAPQGPLLGPGPVAETFPEPLSVLEQDLWLAPLRTALAEAVALAGTASRRRLAASPVLTAVEGRAAADLGLLGFGTEEARSFFVRLDPRPPLRRLVAAWRVGRLRAALPGLADDLLAQADADLLSVPPLSELSDRELLAVLDGSRPRLRALAGHEVLMGWLVPTGTSSVTAASVALRELASARALGLADSEIVSAHPSVLSLVAPRIGTEIVLPPVPSFDAPPTTEADPAAARREALRLRARWVQELGARAAWELGLRLRAQGRLGDPELVRALRLHELEAVVDGSDLPLDLPRRLPAAGPPLPARFRLGADGSPVPVERPPARSRRHRAATTPADGGFTGTGAGGGRATGPAHQGSGLPAEGAVLVVRNLDPALATALPRIAGLVAETGSVLSHLAILARELGVATVVGVPDATLRFPTGTVLSVDGRTGEVIPVPSASGPPAQTTSEADLAPVGGAA